MAGKGHSTFAPYMPGSPATGPRCDHAYPVPLGLPPQLVSRPPASPVETHDAQSARRTRIWEFSPNLHCSIIGTCLSTGELRQTLTRLNLAQCDWTDHELHHKAVSLAARHDQAARLLHKALDRRYKLPISQFGKARTEAELTALWRDGVRRGDIPGAYWAVLTHPFTTQALVRLVFGEVHMLSHLVGAANRADVRRLCDLEQRNADLAAKLSRQQEALHQAVMIRDGSIRDLRQSLRARLTAESPVATDDASAALTALVADLEKRLSAESRRRAIAETRLAETRQDLARERAALQGAAAEVAALRSELSTIEGDLQPDADDNAWRVDGLSLLYVGGRPNQVAPLRALSESRGAEMLHHDGGVEHHPDLLAGLTSRADIVVFPVDCVSHDAARMVKRLCRQADKRFIPLRTASATSLLAALRPLSIPVAASVT